MLLIKEITRENYRQYIERWDQVMVYQSSKFSMRGSWHELKTIGIIVKRSDSKMEIRYSNGYVTWPFDSFEHLFKDESFWSAFSEFVKLFYIEIKP